MKVKYSCEQATILIEQKLRDRISFLQKILLWYHNIICPPCKQYENQSKFIDESISKLCKHNHLSEQELHILKEKIRQQMGLKK